MVVRADEADAAPLARRLGLRSMADALCCRRADGHRVACGAVVAGGMLVGALVVWARRAPIGAPMVALGVKRDMLMLWVPASRRCSSRAALHGLAHGALADDDRPATKKRAYVEETTPPCPSQCDAHEPSALRARGLL